MKKIHFYLKGDVLTDPVSGVVHNDIGQFWTGRVVTTKRDYQGYECLVGHVVGFGLNTESEVVIEVQWCADMPVNINDLGPKRTYIHPDNLIPL
jgi:hypothetical protein